MKWRASWLVIPLLLAACSSKDALQEPSPLPDIKPLVKVDRLWSADTGAGNTGEGLGLVPAVTGTAVYAADEAGVVVAQDRERGKQLWRRALDTPVSAGPAVAYNQVFVGTREGEVLALSAGDGTLQWRTQLSGEVLAVPAVNGDAVAVRTTDGRIALIDRVSGMVRWTHDAGSAPLSLRAASAPLLLADAVLTGTSTGMLVALERTGGQVIWERRIAEPSGKSELDRLIDIAGDFVLDESRVYVATYQGRLVALDMLSGQFLWQQPLSTFRSLALAGDTVYAVDADSRIVSVRTADGVVLWRQEALLGRHATGASVQGDWLLVGDYEGWLHVIRRSDGVLVGRSKVDGDGLVVPAVADDGLVFALGRSGRLVALRLEPGADAVAAGAATP
ncbi:MAG: outer membrane protein assembly factor BamB [Pseudomonadota bacterium]